MPFEKRSSLKYLIIVFSNDSKAFSVSQQYPRTLGSNLKVDNLVGYDRAYLKPESVLVKIYSIQQYGIGFLLEFQLAAFKDTV